MCCSDQLNSPSITDTFDCPSNGDRLDIIKRLSKDLCNLSMVSLICQTCGQTDQSQLSSHPSSPVCRVTWGISRCCPNSLPAHPHHPLLKDREPASHRQCRIIRLLSGWTISMGNGREPGGFEDKLSTAAVSSANG
jgi:hypothetical protein